MESDSGWNGVFSIPNPKLTICISQGKPSQDRTSDEQTRKNFGLGK
jgi:hypothetical protein